MTYKFYAARRDYELRKIPPVARASLNFYFEWLRNIQPLDVIEALEQGKTAEQARQKASIATRMGIAAAKGVLKASKTLQQQLKQSVNVNLALQTLKYENPETYKVIKSYGQRGADFMQQWVDDALKILGVN